MEDWIEIEGKNKDEAIERACDALNTTRSYLFFETLDEGKTTKIRARKREDEEVKEVNTNLGADAKEYLENIVRHIDKDTEVIMEEDESEVRLEISGDQAGLLIGKHGNTLQALQLLVGKMLGLDRTEGGKRLILDAENYRARRKESLEDLAHKLADRARKERRPAGGGPMNAMERRIVHMALLDHPHVTTKSVGQGQDRKVVVYPKRGQGDQGGRSRRGGQRTEGNRSNGSRGNGNRGEGRGDSRGDSRRRGPSNQDNQGNQRESRIISGRITDSFDAPPEPGFELFSEDPDAPMMGEPVRTPAESDSSEE